MEDTLCKAEGIVLQLKEYRKLPEPVKEILGLTPLPVSTSMENSIFMSSSTGDLNGGHSTPTLMAGGGGGVSQSSSSSSQLSSSGHKLVNSHTDSSLQLNHSDNYCHIYT